MYCKLFLRGVVDSSGAIAMVLPLASQKIVLFPVNYLPFKNAGSRNINDFKLARQLLLSSIEDKSLMLVDWIGKRFAFGDNAPSMPEAGPAVAAYSKEDLESAFSSKDFLITHHSSTLPSSPP